MGYFRYADADIFKSEGKALCRRLWDEHSQRMFGELNRPLRYVWLANNQFTDIHTLIPSADSFRIPDNNPKNRAEKKRTLRKYGMPIDGEYLKLTNGIPEAVEDYNPDIVNLDLCNHLDYETLENIGCVVDRVGVSKRMILFASITQRSMRSMMSKRFPKYKRLAKSQEEILDIMNGLFYDRKVKAKLIDGFPVTYKMQSQRPSDMYSFGWELTR